MIAVDIELAEFKHGDIESCLVSDNPSTQSRIWDYYDEKNSSLGLTRPKGANFHLTGLNSFNFEYSPIFSDEQVTYQQSIETEFVITANVSQNGKILVQKFEQEFERFKKYHEAIPKGVRERFNADFNKIAELNFSEIAVDISLLGIKYTLIFGSAQEKILMISSSLDLDNENNSVYSFFINRELISSNALPLKQIIHGFKKFLSR